MNKENIIKSIKIALAAVLSIAIAAQLGLKYSATAGIITVLSIQNTKRETIKSAKNRTLAFVCALFLAAGAFFVLGFTLPAFASYLFLFALLCLYEGWGEAIAMDSVLITHFLGEQSMSFSLIVNETALFFIGTTAGILVNMHLRTRKSLFERLAKDADDQIKGTLSHMSCWLSEEEKDVCGFDHMNQLKETLDCAMACALNNYNNALFNKSTEEIDYIQMREKQSVVLQEIYENIRSISSLPRQAGQVAELLDNIERGYHKNNTVEGLLEELDVLLQDFKTQELPSSREEFEARAILFYILKQLERLLVIKREYVLDQSLRKTKVSEKS